MVLALADATGAPASSVGLTSIGDLGRIVHGELSRLRRGSPWRVALGRAHPGAYGIARSYEEAREGLTHSRPTSTAAWPPRRRPGCISRCGR